MSDVHCDTGCNPMGALALVQALKKDCNWEQSLGTSAWGVSLWSAGGKRACWGAWRCITVATSAISCQKIVGSGLGAGQLGIEFAL